MNKIAIFCGSASGLDPVYMAAARETGEQLAQRHISVVYGGGRVGLMGAVADAALAAGGEVIGVMPQELVDCELAHSGLTELHVVNNMHERKAKMSQLADGFIALPGGAGTLEEIFEQWTWAQLGIHQKPCAFYNINGYYEPLRAMSRQMVKEGFMLARFDEMLTFGTDIRQLIETFIRYVPPARKWQPQPVKDKV
ncbi:LOG family protein [Affinibrenneria salicis]|uniref:LOG family protein n=1 Tax=Affinibrenneria salicis TaxID=2590031 RepID=UPI00168A82E5|nr:TIGR00730 family Rossman fold protein [Affinibrenneria salicis]